MKWRGEWLAAAWLPVASLAAAAVAEPDDDAYQLLRQDPAGYEKVVPGKPLQFPRDHLPHESFRIEWWYMTANLEAENGDEYGMHWTLFRQAMTPTANPGGWQSNQIWMAHAALTTPGDFDYEQRFARGGIGQAGVGLAANDRFEAWMDNWVWRGNGESPLPGTLEFTVNDVQVELALDADTPWVLQGNAGYSQKSELGQASYYYSQPHIRVSGTISGDSGEVRVSGDAWLDREWSSQPLAPDQPGWDWMSLHFDDGHALMVYQLRQSGRENWVSGSWIRPDGTSETLQKSDIVFEPIATSVVETSSGTKSLPLRWRIELPSLGKSWMTEPLDENHWLDTAFPYWEGPVRVEGSSGGRGYLELTGY